MILLIQSQITNISLRGENLAYCFALNQLNQRYQLCRTYIFCKFYRNQWLFRFAHWTSYAFLRFLKSQKQGKFVFHEYCDFFKIVTLVHSSLMFWHAHVFIRHKWDRQVFPAKTWLAVHHRCQVSKSKIKLKFFLWHFPTLRSQPKKQSLAIYEAGHFSIVTPANSWIGKWRPTPHHWRRLCAECVCRLPTVTELQRKNQVWSSA